MTKKAIAKIKVGWWSTYCCEEDLFQITGKHQLAHVKDAIRRDEGEIYEAWPTREIALRELGKVKRIEV